MIPGEVMVLPGQIEINQGQNSIQIKISNNGDRPIQVGSHYHFYEVNPCLEFDRKAAYGKRLNIPAGTAVRFEPGQSRLVELLDYRGLRKVFGFNNQVAGDLKGS